MRTSLMGAALLALSVAGCGGDGMAKVKGKVIENGQPQSFPALQIAVVLTPLGPDGKPDVNKSFTTPLNADGTFELVASGGQVPVGTYQVGIQALGGFKEKLKAFAPETTRVKRDLKSGSNDITLDLSRPEG